MQALTNVRRIGLKPSLLTRAVTTTKYTRVYKKEAAVPKKVEEEPKLVSKADAEAKLGGPVTEFPTTTQFDTLKLDNSPTEGEQNWSTSFYGLSTVRFPDEVANILLEPINVEDIEIKPGKLKRNARGEQDFFDVSGLPTAAEGCKSNALMRCCKDLGVASELWDPVFIRKFKKKYCTEVWAEHVTTKKKKKLWKKKDDYLEYPYKET
ncbi:hypothetical protein G6F37_009709 [Rhizopus arrhizus]|nr:hypothetical protein G6F38_011419 [Rhizopus arrhizus]KAG1154151.1 hypothetical protein G6F37_009709 [Rhizopus arrhizus]